MNGHSDHHASNIRLKHTYKLDCVTPIQTLHSRRTKVNAVKDSNISISCTRQGPCQKKPPEGGLNSMLTNFEFPNKCGRIKML